MKTMMLCILLLAFVNAQSQPSVSFAGKQSGSIISEKEINGNAPLLVNFDEGVVERFDMTAITQGFEMVLSSPSNKLTPEQKELFKSLIPGQKFYFENIKIRLKKDGSSIKTYFIMTKDGPNADVLKRKGEYSQKSVDHLIQNPRIYAYPDFSSFDTSQFTVSSFKIKSHQPDYYYELESTNNLLTPEMILLLKRATNDITVSNIKAADKNKQSIDFLDITIEAPHDAILRSKGELAKAKMMDFVSPASDIKAISFKLRTACGKTEKDSYLKSPNMEFTTAMKDFIRESQIGDVLWFEIMGKNGMGEEQNMQVNVKLVN
ncbi:MAG: hypothetical protein K9H64_21275 [Bacteroidales bacterium]|nr:hypothetical protein [Bacteroidales bacterium]MCF8458572.1 hypothetical protein [Bacteroidales bacterium]